MYTAIRDYKLNVESLDDETLKRVNDEWVPILQSTDGFIEYHIIDSGDSRLTTVGVFEQTEKHSGLSETALGIISSSITR